MKMRIEDIKLRKRYSKKLKEKIEEELGITMWKISYMDDRDMIRAETLAEVNGVDTCKLWGEFN